MNDLVPPDNSIDSILFCFFHKDAIWETHGLLVAKRIGNTHSSIPFLFSHSIPKFLLHERRNSPSLSLILSQNSIFVHLASQCLLNNLLSNKICLIS